MDRAIATASASDLRAMSVADIHPSVRLVAPDSAHDNNIHGITRNAVQ